ncbi:type I DNA topoisomerase [Eubacterium xylanophilum]|uniref:type I DNA topoisomerase n=1 Tax=Eubacterium xylanophilum TaxID=39497 RepID=UPI00047D7E1B|nr:type I DNA topoisomerase [Eubacterium xylanophilum]
MAKNLIIVESPAKSKTIKKFLGSNYNVVASNGHVRDLPKSKMGIDFDNDFEPQYITIRGKGELLAQLRKEVKKADKIFLATDPDREGEAISWHLCNALKLDMSKTKRITFNEITKNAVRQAIKQSREIDMNLVDAQQARRALDRVVGYSISPLLWEKVKRGLSAGRVQSVALHIIAEREAEIDAFIAKEYWSLDALFEVKGSKKPLEAHYYGDPKKKEFITRQELDEIISDLKNAKYEVKEKKIGERIKKPPLPFTTSTMQQEASKNLNFATQKTMRVAQQLYEGISIKGHGTVGLISYLRTDSTRISEEADQECKEFIKKNYGDEYIISPKHVKEDSRKIQDAHEAIRPTDVNLTPSVVKDSLTREQFRLYQLIWKRFVASRMDAAKYETMTVKIEAGKHSFRSTGSKIAFPGFLAVEKKSSDKAENNAVLKKVEVGDKLKFSEFSEEQHFTQPPAHYTEASLVKTLEDMGIGRPSTYAPTISTLINRRYVAKEQKNLYLSDLGDIVDKIMVSAFPSIIDAGFTAMMETLLDGVAEGNVKWKDVLRNFYPDFREALDHAESNLEKVEIKDEVSDEICENCGKNMVIKYGPHGKFLACPGFPDCRNTKPYFEKIGVKCPKCGGDIVIKKTQKGRRYYGCSNYPECEVMTWQKPSNHKCPKCGDMLLEKGNKYVCVDQNCGTVLAKSDIDKDSKSQDDKN